MSSLVKVLVSSLAILGMAQAQAGIVKVGVGAFTPSAGLITFSEFALGTVNPTYNPSDYGGGVGSPVVKFEGYFSGQSLSATPGVDCPGGAASGCVSGAASSPLSLDAAAPDTRIVSDGANPTSPVLSGTPTFNGPIAILFSTLQAGVGLDGGFFNAIGGTAITAFDKDGNSLGTVKNEALGIEFLGLVTADGTEQIAGLLFSLVGAEPAGFGIDNVRFGKTGEVIVPTPEPASIALLGLGFAGLGWSRRRKAA